MEDLYNTARQLRTSLKTAQNSNFSSINKKENSEIAQAKRNVN